METKVCENCDATVGTAETTCPQCHVTFADLDDAIATVERANNILAKRKAKATPPAPPEPEATPESVPAVPQKKQSVFSSLGKAIRKP